MELSRVEALMRDDVRKRGSCGTVSFVERFVALPFELRKRDANMRLVLVGDSSSSFSTATPWRLRFFCAEDAVVRI